jgi:hypothetical protein
VGSQEGLEAKSGTRGGGDVKESLQHQKEEEKEESRLQFKVTEPKSDNIPFIVGAFNNGDGFWIGCTGQKQPTNHC